MNKMIEMIDREEVLNLIQYYTDFDSELYKEVQKLPLMNRKGHWIPNECFYGTYDYTCSECKKHSDERSEFCRKCGAIMVESQESEEV